MQKNSYSLIQSPPARLSEAKNLTGITRHVKDLAAIIHANIQEWNSNHLRGLTLLKNIVEEHDGESCSQVLQELCDKLEAVCNALDDIVNNFKEVVHQIKVTICLHKSPNKLFTTWPIEKFDDIARLIYEAYLHEASIKRQILENILHDDVEVFKMLYLATWVHQPSIPITLTMHLESLLTEVGYR
ncbi:hypothetical protein KM043_017777 [Ampulex compressa]|nr:hypothetical protein KM043_017777 [Ampulex compressa]